jgi:hypothetical protein
MEISLATFKKLLHSLKDRGVPLKVKTHTGWSKEYLHIIGFISSIQEHDSKAFGGVVLSNLAETEGILINNIATILAFELDMACDDYEARKEYILSDNLSLQALIVE